MPSNIGDEDDSDEFYDACATLRFNCTQLHPSKSKGMEEEIKVEEKDEF